MSTPNAFSESTYPSSATTPYGTSSTTTSTSTNTTPSSPTATTTRGDVKATANDLKSQASTTASQAKDNLNNVGAQAKENLNAAGAQAQVKMQQAGAKIQELAGQAASHPVVQDTQVKVQKQVEGLDRELSKYPILNTLSDRTHIPKPYLLFLILIPLLLIITFNIFSLAAPITNLVGWFAPALLSIAALESKGDSDDKQWLTYWVVFGYINFLESFALKVLLYYVPYYFLFKLVGTIWLMLPQTRGAEKVYFSALRPAFRTLVTKIQPNNAPYSSSSSRGTTTPANTFSSPVVSDNIHHTTSTGTSTSISTGSGLTSGEGLVERPMGEKSNNPFVGATSGVAVAPESGVVGGEDIVA